MEVANGDNVKNIKEWIRSIVRLIKIDGPKKEIRI
jgi:hypothetical protein